MKSPKINLFIIIWIFILVFLISYYLLRNPKDKIDDFPEKITANSEVKKAGKYEDEQIGFALIGPVGITLKKEQNNISAYDSQGHLLLRMRFGSQLGNIDVYCGVDSSRCVPISSNNGVAGEIKFGLDGTTYGFMGSGFDGRVDFRLDCDTLNIPGPDAVGKNPACIMRSETISLFKKILEGFVFVKNAESSERRFLRFKPSIDVKETRRDKLCIGSAYPIRWVGNKVENVNLFVKEVGHASWFIGRFPLAYNEFGKEREGYFDWKVGYDRSGKQINTIDEDKKHKLVISTPDDPIFGVEGSEEFLILTCEG